MGPILVTLTDTRGIHLGDLPVLGLWIVGLVCGVILWRDRSS
jgi:hypothetical protein